MEGYELVDVGDGRRLERFGGRLVDRPAPATGGPRRDRSAWGDADLRFDRERGWRGGDVGPWTARFGELTLELRPTDAGQVGLFPEHGSHWSWLRAQVGTQPSSRVLHLFAYTGATTLAVARAGAAVVHVDASRPTVAWARRNAQLSGLSAAAVRWIVDDAEGFVAREVRRERRYEGVVLDPPSYGHGTGGRSWRLEDRLPSLLEGIGRLGPAWVLLTAHTPGWDGDRLADALASSLPRARIESGRHDLVARSGSRLSLGAFARGMIPR